MVSPIYGVKFEKSGYAVVLRERPDLGTDELDQTESGRPFREHPELYLVGFDVPEMVDLGSLQLPGIWQYLFVSDEPRYDWLDHALARSAGLSSGSDKAYAELALRQASHVAQREPRIYNAPGGGVVIESQTRDGILTLLIEDPIGVIVRTADEFRVSAEFHITPHSINELLARYVSELRLLLSAQGQ
jgi:hypothetical protein